jgi:RNA polymerase sigma-B factor
LDDLGSVDSRMERIDDQLSLAAVLNTLPERERRIVLMRFFESMTQSQIAEQIGCSQMHVSRILTRTLQTLREQLE